MAPHAQEMNEEGAGERDQGKIEIKKKNEEGRKTCAIHVENPDITHEIARKAPKDCT